MMRILSATLLTSLIATASFGQSNPEKYAATVNKSDLKKHLTVVAGAKMEGRETATPGQKKAAEYLSKKFKAIGLTPGNNGSYLQHFGVNRHFKGGMSMDTGRYVDEYAKTKLTSSNVIAILEGSDKKEEYVFVTAHYDHLGKKGNVIYYGADDDGSGTVTLLELAEAFAKAKKEGNGPRRTIVFMAFSGEEKGLWGSRYYAKYPILPLEKTSVGLNIDMVGRIDASRDYGDSNNYIYVVGDDKLSSDLKPISESVNSKYSNLELDYKYNDPNDPQRIYYRSDHFNFAKSGVPVIFYFSGLHPDYHQPTDTIDKINFDLMEKRARLIFHTAWEMANREDMLKRDIPLN